jgi:hypothetical protein
MTVSSIAVCAAASFSANSSAARSHSVVSACPASFGSSST